MLNAKKKKGYTVKHLYIHSINIFIIEVTTTCMFVGLSSFQKKYWKEDIFINGKSYTRLKKIFKIAAGSNVGLGKGIVWITNGFLKDCISVVYLGKFSPVK